MPAHVPEIITPIGLAQYFREVFRALTEGGPSGSGQRTEIRDRCHLHDVDRSPKLMGTYVLTLLGK